LAGAALDTCHRNRKARIIFVLMDNSNMKGQSVILGGELSYELIIIVLKYCVVKVKH
jgi:hypothetical protein